MLIKLDQTSLEATLRATVAQRGHLLEDIALFQDGRWKLRELPDEVAAAVVIKGFDLADYVNGTMAFVFGLDETERLAWYKSFTKTLFLAGDPAKVALRYGAILGGQQSDLAWVRPGSSKTHMGLRRLLKPLHTAKAVELPTNLKLVIAGSKAARSPLRRRLRIEKNQILERYLVHLNRTLAEGVIGGVLQAGDELLIEHVDTLAGDLASVLYSRIHADMTNPTQLKLYTVVDGDKEVVT